MLLRVIKSFKTFAHRANIKTWLYRIVQNTSITKFKREQRYSEVKQLYHYTAIGQQRISVELLRELQEKLTELPHLERKAVLLTFFFEYSQKETAKLLECAEGTIAWRIHNAKQKLRVAN